MELTLNADAGDADSLGSLRARWSPHNGSSSLIWFYKPGSIFCSPATQLMFSQRGVVALWLSAPLCSSVSSPPLAESQQNKPRPEILQSCIVPPANYKAVHAQPSFISDKNNTKIENHSTHLEKHGETKGS